MNAHFNRKKCTLEDIAVDEKLYREFSMHAQAQGVGVLVAFYRDVLAFRHRTFKSLSETSTAAREIATNYLGLLDGEDLISDLVALSKDDLERVQKRLDEDDPAPSMFDAITDKVERVLSSQFRTWQGSATAHKRSLSERSSSIALSRADDFAQSEGALLGNDVRCPPLLHWMLFSIHARRLPNSPPMSPLNAF